MNKFILAAFTLLTTGIVAQTIVVDRTGNNNDPYWLAENVLVDPDYVIFRSFNQSGVPIVQPPTNQIGVFKVLNNAGAAAFPLDSGIIMCTDYIEDILPNTTGINPGTTTNPKDADLNGVLSQIGSANVDINDMAEIRFSFVATSDSIEFNYVFASHEYTSYTCSQFNDVFGFFLEGNGINGAASGTKSIVNLATIPGTTVPVAINTINSGQPSGSYPASNCLNANPNYVAHSVYFTGAKPYSSLTGYTTKFTAKAKVICNYTYEIRLKIANASDHAFGSAVFLEANSFRSPSIKVDANLNSGNSFQDTQIVEGCEPAYIVFHKDGNINNDMHIRLSYFGNAIHGVDYAPLPDSLFIPSGSLTDTLEILAYDDGIAEHNDSIIIYMHPVNTPCYQYRPQEVVFHFRDKTPVDASAKLVQPYTDTVECPGDSVRIEGLASGGEGILYGWWADDNTQTSSRLVTPMQTTTYFYYATDECAADTSIASVTIYVKEYTPIKTTGDTIMICRGDETVINALYDLGSPPYAVLWDNNTTIDARTVKPTNDSTWYVFQVIDKCRQVALDSVLVWMAPDPYAGFNYLNDPGVPLRVDFSNTSLNGFSYHWDFGDGTTSTDTMPSHTYTTPDDYTVTLTIISKEGCEDTYTSIVTVDTDFYLYVPTAFTPDGDGINELFEIKGLGFETFQISIFNRWGNQVFFSDDINVSWDGTYNGKNVPAGVYSYTIFIKMPLGDISEKKGTLTVYR